MEHYYNMYGDDPKTVYNLLRKVVLKQSTCKETFGEVGKDKSSAMLDTHRYQIMRKAILRNILSLHIIVRAHNNT